MLIDVSKLNNLIDDYILIDEVYSFSKEELENSGILELNNVKVSGEITKNSLGEYIIDIDVNGKMVLPCSLTLKPTNYDFNVNIQGNLKEIYEEIGKNLENNQKTIDILPIIWENILMEIPIKVVNEDVDDLVVQGDGWELKIDE